MRLTAKFTESSKKWTNPSDGRCKKIQPKVHVPSQTETPQSSIVRWERKCKEQIKKEEGECIKARAARNKQSHAS
jgi:hypothetical protein